MANGKGDAPKTKTIKINKPAFEMAVDLVARRMVDAADRSDSAVAALLHDDIIAMEAAKLQSAFETVMAAMIALSRMPLEKRFAVLQVIGATNGFQPTGLFDFMNWAEKMDALQKEKANGKRH